MHKDFKSVARTTGAGEIDDGGKVAFAEIPVGTYGMTYGSGAEAKLLINRVGEPMYGDNFYIENGQINRFWTQAATPISGSVKITDGVSDIAITEADANAELFADVSSVVPSEAISGGLISYQWYKDDVAIANATNASYTPVESGVYHCVVSGSQVYGGKVQSNDVSVKGPHIHDEVTFTEWTATSGTLKSGNYYLSESNATALTSGVTIPAGATVNLCLNGKTLDIGNTTIFNNGILNICDCQSSGQIVSGAHCVRNSMGSTLTVTGGNIKSSGTGSYGIFNFNGTTHISGGTVQGAYGIYNTGICNVSGGDVIGTSNRGIHNTGTCTISGGAIECTKSFGVYNSGTLTVSGGTVQGKKGIYNAMTCTVTGGAIKGTGADTLSQGIETAGSLYLAGIPKITGQTGALLLGNNGKIYATAKEDGTGGTYTGSRLTIYLYKPADWLGQVIVHRANEGQFSLTASNYSLIQGSGDNANNLVLAPPHTHSWATAWSSDGTAHWHECVADDCDVTENSKKDGYETHTPEADDGSCVTAIKCSKCDRETTPATSGHSFTTRASQHLGSAANCQQKEKYYVQCDNCNVVSDTLTVEVGSLGEHNWDTEWSKDENNHWHKCLIAGCTEIAEEAKHSSTGGNKATYTKKAICDECGKEYGDVVPDEEKPTGEITIYGNIWREFINTITFGIFCRDTQTVDITVKDVGLGVNKAEYFNSETEYANVDAVLQDNGISWKSLTLNADGKAKFNIGPNAKIIVYLKIIDNAGNVTVIRSNGIVLDDIKPQIAGIEDGKTYCGAVEATVSDTYFDKVTVNGVPVTETDGRFSVNPASGAQTVIAYDKAGNTTTYTITVNDGHTYIYNESTADTIVEKCQHCDFSASAQIKKPTGELIYNGEPHNATVVYTGTLSGSNNLNISYGDATDTVGAGDYTASIAFGGKTVSVKYTVSKAKVTPPTINGKVYDGNTQTADIPTNKLYTVTANDGGKNVGNFDVVLKLTDGNNYEWDAATGVSGDEITLKFSITKAANDWSAAPSIHDWTFGEGAQKPTGKAKFGTVVYKYYDAAKNELTGVPKDAGSYHIKGFVAGTDNYDGIESDYAQFTIEQRKVTIKWFAPDSLVFDGTAKLPHAEYTGGPTDDDDPQIIVELTEGCDNMNAGSFTFTAIGIDDSNYVLYGDNLVSPEYTITERPLQDGDFTAVINGLVYTGSAIEPVVESTNKLVTAKDFEIAYESNINASTNTDIAKIIITGRGNASGKIEIPFTIAKADYPVVWPENLVGKQGESLSTVALPEGFTWDNADEEIKYGEDNTYAMTYRPVDIANYNAMHKNVVVNGADVTAPTAEITLGTNGWNSFFNNITFGLFFKETQTITVTANDKESGVDEIAYYLASAEMTAEELKTIKNSVWTVYSEAFDIDAESKYVIYVKVIDRAGNTIYINSDGVVLDKTVPVIVGIENGKEVYGDITFTVGEENLDVVTIDGIVVDAVDGKYTITADDAEHTVVVTDKAGNKTEYTLTVYLKRPTSPQTGDAGNTFLWLAVLFVSGFGVMAVRTFRKKKIE